MLSMEDLISHPRHWDVQVLKNTFEHQYVKAIFCMQPPPLGREDHWLWALGTNGSFMVKSAYLIDQS